MKKFIIITAILMTANLLSAQIINIPDDYPTIQQGIDASNNGDTILVQPGTYYENIFINGKDITVASLVLITQDTSYISQTIIDGGHSGSVVTVQNPYLITPYLCGFTLTNGYSDYGGGICADNGDPSLQWMVITGNEATICGGGMYCHWYQGTMQNIIVTNNISGNDGGGIFSTFSELIIDEGVITNNTAGASGGGIYSNRSGECELSNILITNNFAGDNGGGLIMWSPDQCVPNLENVIFSGNISGASGGGLACMYNANPTLNHVTIENNIAIIGGGIYSENYAAPYLKNSRILNNVADQGGGIFCEEDANILFSHLELCDLYLNIADFANDIYTEHTLNIKLDTFSVITPTVIYACPLTNITFQSIQHGIIEQIDADLYVSPSGDDNNSGLSSNEPLKTIRHAISIILPGNDIYLADGLYSPSSNDEFFPVFLPGSIGIYGNGPNTVTLNPEIMKDVVNILNINNSILSGLTITGGNNGIYCENSDDFTFENIVITDNQNSGISCVNAYPVINNVSITNNTGGGIYLSNSDPIIEHSTISNNNGCGIYAWFSIPVINDAVISGNTSTGSGGGIYSLHSWSKISNSIITGNNATTAGGGIYSCGGNGLELLNVSIFNNSANSGGGIYADSPVQFDSENRCNIYLNDANLGSDLFSSDYYSHEIYLDTFSVMYPNSFYAHPITSFDFDILHFVTNQVDADLFISPDGDNLNSGLSDEEPLKNIRYAFSNILADSNHTHTIHLLEGTYSPATNEEIFPINIIDYIGLSGSSETTVVLDAEETGSVIYVANNASNFLSGMTITGGCDGGIDVRYSNLKIQGIIINENSTDFYGGGIYSMNSNLELFNVDVINNSADAGGGVYLSNSLATFTNVQISGNYASGYSGWFPEGGGGLFCENTDPLLMNVSLTNNSCNYGGGIHFKNSNPQLMNVLLADNWSYYGGGIYGEITDPLLVNVTLANNYAEQGSGLYGVGNSHFKLINCIFYGLLGQEIRLGSEAWGSDTITISYSDIQGGETGIITTDSSKVNWLEGNIDEDPLFVSYWVDYQLSAGSPCIDAGTPDTTGLNLPEWDLLGNVRIWDGDGNGIAIIDMGAYEFGSVPVGVPEIDPAAYEKTATLKMNVHPNPVSNPTIIEFELPKSNFVSINIFNSKGKIVAVLKDSFFKKGKQQVDWNAGGLPPGIYFCRIQAGGEARVIKIIKN